MRTVGKHDHLWAIVLAAGDGTRLSALTKDAHGNSVPKQFCSLNGDASLIEQTLVRAKSVVADERITAVVSPTHARHWKTALKSLPSENIVVQPINRGTAIGILLPALRILARDPNARVLILPSDHHVADEAILANAMRSALHSIAEHPLGVALLGIEAHESDPELGYIVPNGGDRSGLRSVRCFVEKPAVDEAHRLRTAGALWNSFIIAARAQHLVDLCLRRCAEVVTALRAIDLRDYAQLVQLYCELPEIDFSRHIATGQEARLAVMTVPPCGWNDLGTPHRLAQTLAQTPRLLPQNGDAGRGAWEGKINLAERLMGASSMSLSGGGMT